MFGKGIKNYKYIIAAVIILLVSIKINLTKTYKLQNTNINRAISSTAESTPNSPDEIKNQMISSVVRLSYFSNIPSIMNLKELDLTKMSSATGFSIGYDQEENISIILTNDHFCERIVSDPTAILLADKSNVAKISDERATGIPGEVIYTSPEYDLCLVKIFGEISGARLAPHDCRPNQFDKIYIIGAPAGLLPIIVETFFSADLPRSEIFIGSLASVGEPFLLTSEEVYPGHSGSPIFNENGEVIGIIFASFPTYGGIGIPVGDIHKFLQDANNFDFINDFNFIQ